MLSCDLMFIGPSRFGHQMRASRLAEQHYQLQLKKRAWASWLSLIQRGWKDKAERACRARAEEVCTHLTADYQAKLAEVRGPYWERAEV